MAGKSVGQIGVSTVGGGIVTGPGAVGRLTLNGVPAVLVGDHIASHAPNTGAHVAATMIQGSSNLRVNGVPVCRTGDAASCGHTLIAAYPKLLD